LRPEAASPAARPTSKLLRVVLVLRRHGTVSTAIRGGSSRKSLRDAVFVWRITWSVHVHWRVRILAYSRAAMLDDNVGHDPPIADG